MSDGSREAEHVRRSLNSLVNLIRDAAGEWRDAGLSGRDPDDAGIDPVVDTATAARSGSSSPSSKRRRRSSF